MASLLTIFMRKSLITYIFLLKTFVLGMLTLNLLGSSITLWSDNQTALRIKKSVYYRPFLDSSQNLSAIH